jgi:hypothetical protein
LSQSAHRESRARRSGQPVMCRPSERQAEGTLREHHRGHRRLREVTLLRAIPSSCAAFVPAASRPCPPFPACRSMVRRGSTVRVRQRASVYRLLSDPFCCLYRRDVLASAWAGFQSRLRTLCRSRWPPRGEGATRLVEPREGRARRADRRARCSSPSRRG